MISIMIILMMITVTAIISWRPSYDDGSVNVEHKQVKGNDGGVDNLLLAVWLR